MDDKALFYAFNKWCQMTKKTLCQAAGLAGKVRVAACFTAVVGKLKVPGSLVQVSFVYQRCFAEALESAVNGNLVKTIFA